MKKSIFIKAFIFLCLISHNVLAQHENQVNITLAKPRIKLVDNKNNLGAVVESILKESITQYSGMLNLVDRDSKDLAAKERKKFAKANLGMKANTQLGADYIFESKIYDIAEKLNEKIVTKYIKAKPVKETHYTYDLSFTLDIDVVSVETGESVKKMTLYPNGWYYPQKAHKGSLVNEAKYRNDAVIDCMSCIRMMIGIMILDIFPIDYKIIGTFEQDKDKVKKVSIGVGNKSRFQKGQKFEIVREYVQEVSGQSINRQEKIAEAKFNESFLGHTVLDVKKGKKELFQLLNGPDLSLVCVPTKVKTIDKCSGLFQPKKRTAMRSSFSKLASSDEKPKTKEEIKKEQEKDRIQKKKVKKKNG